eukprot:NODE_3013_length_610_cov_65.557932_g2517_i0.p1 GENE.NODE_3013_length_610_cov_65.557932_g2517_i0~~NODE_3013_length_610_cov_65.557932_g2517_i0.p1  ORF type:complete len:53 (+),score=7.95 NODE_3013_length_610_cov_65.557932_g2517_i0:248-406(+)
MTAHTAMLSVVLVCFPREPFLCGLKLQLQVAMQVAAYQPLNATACSIRGCGA